METPTRPRWAGEGYARDIPMNPKFFKNEKLPTRSSRSSGNCVGVANKILWDGDPAFGPVARVSLPDWDHPLESKWRACGHLVD